MGLPSAELVRDRARRREPERAGADRLGGEPAHLRRSRRRSGPRRGRRRGRPSRSRAARHAAPARAKSIACGVESMTSRYSGNDLPAPRDALVQRGAGDVLDALHELDEPVVPVGPHRREADAAVAHDHGRDAVPRRRREQRVPGDLAVVVRVHVDPARGDEQARRRRARRGPVPSTSPTAVMRRRRSRRRRGAAARRVPSTTVPPRITRSWSAIRPPPVARFLHDGTWCVRWGDLSAESWTSAVKRSPPRVSTLAG